MRGPLILSDEALGPVPERGRAAIRAIVAGVSACGDWAKLPALALDALPDAECLACADLILAGWLAIWHDHPAGTHVCLTPWAAAELGLAIAEDVRVVYAESTHEEPVVEVLRTVDPDGACTFETRERVRLVRRSWTLIEEVDAWAPAGAVTQARIPRADGFAGMILGDGPAAPAEPDPGPEPDLLDLVGPEEEAEPLVILGVEADPLRPRPRSKKRTKSRRGVLA